MADVERNDGDSELSAAQRAALSPADVEHNKPARDLDDAQRAALAQLTELTNAADDDLALSVLSSVDWDVQRAAEFIFGATPSVPAVPVHTFDVDDSQQRPMSASYRPPGPSTLTLIARPLITLLSIPIHILSNILRFVLNLLRIPIPQLRLSSLNFAFPFWRNSRTPHHHRRAPLGGASGPARWVRELEEETGAECIGRARTVYAASSALPPAASSSAGMTARAGLPRDDDARRVLPDFALGSYEETLRMCEREARICCVVLVSNEHDDVAEFKRTTLTDPSLVGALSTNNIVTWGGDVRDPDAWSAAQKLQATTFPFVAFLALQSRANPGATASSSSSSRPPSPALTVMSRHQGPATPENGPTAPNTLVAHLTQHILPRIATYLERMRAAETERRTRGTREDASRRSREAERRMRELQDMAFRETAERDRARIQERMREEVEAQRKTAERRDRETRTRVRGEWRRWTRACVTEDAMATTITKSGGGQELRIAIRLPSGERLVRSFKSTTTLTALYAFVDAQLVPGDLPADQDPTHPPHDGTDDAHGEWESIIEHKAATTQGWWPFQLVTAYPRVPIAWAGSGARVCDLPALQDGGQIVVEMVDGVERGEDDGYSTEDSV